MIRIRHTTFKSKEYIDIRKFFVPKGQTVEVPSKKGISIPIDELSNVITELEQLEKDKLTKGDVK